jgi:hypothetical protein
MINRQLRDDNFALSECHKPGLDRDGLCEDLPLPLAHVGDKKVKRFHFSEIIGRLPYMRATVTG